MLRFRYRLRHRNMPKASGVTEHNHGKGPEGRIQKLRELVTALVRHERIEGHYNYLDEARPYAELLIQRAQRFGDRHKETMELADYWLLEKDLIHKLFKVLAPRYSNFPTAYTNMHLLPRVFPGRGWQVGCLELKGNPWPPVKPHHRDLHGTLVNVLVEEMRRDHSNQNFRHPADKLKESVKGNQTPVDLQTPETVRLKEGTPV